MRKRIARRPKPETSKRQDGKLLKWEWFYETELGNYPRSWIKRFPHVADRGRWVVTEIVDNEKDFS
mgnify:CR=1 FL=1|jgi:hypothetical protein